MAKLPVNKKKSKLVLPTMTTVSLQGKQSVRETFKLSSSCINAINIVAKQLRIKQKSLFDHLTEDVASLESIAQKAASSPETAAQRSFIQKSYVISRNTLRTLTEVSKRFDVSRDVLIERSVQRLLPVIEKEKKNHRKRMQLLQDVETYIANGNILLQRIEQSVGAEDPLYQAFRAITASCSQVKGQMDDVIERGKKIEAFQAESLQ
jgi:hypothetical protein